MLAIRGYVDTMTCSQLLNRITEILNQKTFHIIVDMAQVSYVSSAGWGVFVGEIKDIREKGGDLKIVQMTPEVYDVFEMLEFNKILSYYESIEEAMNDFDLSIGLDITKSVARSYQPEDSSVGTAVPKPSQRTPVKPSFNRNSQFAFKKQVDEKRLPLTEKIKLVIIDDPRKGVMKIKQALKTERFGYTKIGSLKLYRILKKLNLEDNTKRYRFYRSR